MDVSTCTIIEIPAKLYAQIASALAETPNRIDLEDDGVMQECLVVQGTQITNRIVFVTKVVCA